MLTKAHTLPQALRTADDCIAEACELAEFAGSIFADAHRLRDRVSELENSGMEIPAVVDAVDRLHATANAAARELATVVDDFQQLEWPGRSWRRNRDEI